jgi:hypothetical protein
VDVAHHESLSAGRLGVETNFQVVEEIEEAESCNEVDCGKDDVPIDVLNVSQ